jgi:tetratricopeptide (TPR) repeat protein
MAPTVATPVGIIAIKLLFVAANSGAVAANGATDGRFLRSAIRGRHATTPMGHELFHRGGRTAQGTIECFRGPPERSRVVGGIARVARGVGVAIPSIFVSYSRQDMNAVQAHEQALTANGIAVWRDQDSIYGGEQWPKAIAEAATAYRQALRVRTLETPPLQRAQTQKNLARVYAYLEDWPNAAASYTLVLQVYPDDEHAYHTASYLYHERLFKFPEAFTLNQKWLGRHPEDLSALSDFAEKHFTTGRFTECEQRTAALLASPAIEPRINIAPRAIEIANRFALGNLELIPDSIDTLRGIIVNQSEDFKVNWSFGGAKYFIRHDKTLAPYRSWLLQFFNGAEAEDRQAILTARQDVRATIAAIVKQ